MPENIAPGFFDYLLYGPNTGQEFENRRAVAAKKEQAVFDKQRLNDLLELSALTTGNQRLGIPEQPAFIEQDGFTVPNPIAGSAELSPKQQADLLLLGEDAGISQDDISAQQNRDALSRIIPQLPITQQVDALGNKSITAPASTAGLNTAKTNLVQLRTNALRGVLDNPALDPLISADVANDKSVADTQRVKVQQKDGTEAFYDARLNIDGSFSYTPATGKSGEPLRIKPSASGDGRTSLQKDTAFIQDIFGIDATEALKLKLELKTKSPEEAYSALVVKLATANFGRLARDSEKLKTAAAKVWQVSRPGVPVPVDGDNIISDAVKRVPVADDTSGSTQEEARNRAGADGYSNLGNWIDGKGWEVLDDSGQLIGHYN